MKFAKFVARPAERGLIEKQFTLHSAELDFSLRNPKYLATVPNVSGVYFIGGIRDGALLKAYIGKAASLRKRLNDYHRGFQVHSPNDGKMRFLQEWLQQEDPGWRLCLYTIAVGVRDISRKEGEWIAELKPLVNGTIRADSSHKEEVRTAYRGYFHGFFRKRILGE